mgnify:CR=1 FL=1
MKESVLRLKENTTQHWIYTFKLTASTKDLFMTDPLNIIV